MSQTGLIVAFEGVHGSGKSSQLDYLRTRLQDLGFGVAVSDGNSHPVMRPAVQQCKIDETLMPLSVWG